MRAAAEVDGVPMLGHPQALLHATSFGWHDVPVLLAYAAAVALAGAVWVWLRRRRRRRT